MTHSHLWGLVSGMGSGVAGSHKITGHKVEKSDMEKVDASPTQPCPPPKKKQDGSPASQSSSCPPREERRQYFLKYCLCSRCEPAQKFKYPSLLRDYVHPQ